METLKILTESHVTYVELHRPEVGNAFNPLMISELTKAFKALMKDDQTRVVVLRGAGKHFCSGGDLHWMKSSIDYKKRENVEDALKLYDMFLTIYRFPKPLIAQVHGAAYAGGFGLVACADVAVASSDSLFSLSETRLGLVPSVIAPFTLRKIGLSNLKVMGLSAKKLSAQEAKDISLVHDVVEPKDLNGQVGMWIQEFMQNGTLAMSEFKNLLWHIETKPIPLTKAKITRAIAKARTSKEGQEGLKAFFQKRPPSWRA